MSSSSSSGLEVRYTLSGRRASFDISILEIRLSSENRLVFDYPIYEVESTFAPMAHTLVPFPCCPLDIVQLLSSFNLDADACTLIASQIEALATHSATRFLHFHIVAVIDHIQTITFPPLNPMAVIDDTFILGSELEMEHEAPTSTGASKSAIERLLKKGKCTGLGEDCRICLVPNEKEAVKMPCNHMYHESCISQWLKINNSCPLCRSPLE